MCGAEENSSVDPASGWVWANWMGGAVGDNARSVAATASDVYIVGDYRNFASFGPASLTMNTSATLGFVARMNPDGSW